MADRIFDKNTINEVVVEHVASTERIIGDIMKKRNVKFTDTTRKNIRGEIIKKANGLIEINYYYRDALRFTDMGAGKGYRKGVSISQSDYRHERGKNRKRKKILMRPLYGRLNALMSQVSAQIIELATLDFSENIK